MKRYKFLDGYEFSGCAVRRWNIVSFFGTKWEDKDALETRLTGVFYYYADEPPAKQWAYREIGMTTGIHGTAVLQPQERWVFMMDDGAVFVAGGGQNTQEAITSEKAAFFSSIRTIGGKAYAAGPLRRVFRREADARWRTLDKGLPSASKESDIGFADIDGFGDNEIYACGGKGDLWAFDGTAWSRIELPTNAALERICCGEDGLAYILTDQKSFVIGRARSWGILEQDVTTKVLEQIVWYKDRIYVSSGDALFEVEKGVFQPCAVPPPQRSCKNLASGDGILVVAGGNEASVYDGAKWTVILTPP